MFRIRANDGESQSGSITTAFMDRLLQLTASWVSNKIECSFYMMMIPMQRNMFEPGSIFGAEDFVDDSKSLLRETNLLFQIIDILK